MHRWDIIPRLPTWHIQDQAPDMLVLRVRTATGTGPTACSMTLVVPEMLDERKWFALALRMGKRDAEKWRRDHLSERAA